jgi:hypothetical protein
MFPLKQVGQGLAKYAGGLSKTGKRAAHVRKGNLQFIIAKRGILLFTGILRQ